jgi:DNA primase
MKEAFQLGAHPGGYHDLSEYLSRKGFSRDMSAQLGLLSRTQSGDWIDRFRGRLMFPILDERGRIRGFGGRSLGDEQPKYINSPKSSVFDKGRLFYGMHLAASMVPKKGFAVLVEGYLDVMALHEFGVGNTLGSMGTALTIDQVRLLKRMSSRVISLYDADRAGLAATEKNLGAFLREGIEAKVVVLPTGKDPDAFLHQEGRSHDDLRSDLRTAFENSTLALDFLIKNSVLPEKTPLARAQKIRDLIRVLDEMPDEIERSLVKKDIARRFELSESLLQRTEGPAAAQRRPSPPVNRPSAAAVDPKLPQARRERDLAKFVVQYGAQAPLILTELLPFLTVNSLWGDILRTWAEAGFPSAAISRLENLEDLESLKGFEEARSQLLTWIMDEGPELNESQVQDAWNDMIQRLKKVYYQGYSLSLQEKIRDAEKADDFEQVRKLLGEKQDLARVLKSLEVRESVYEEKTD